MNNYLTRIGIPPDIQTFFNAGHELSFNYGDDHEHFAEGFHKIPTTRNLWVAGNETAAEVIISHSAMEAMAFLTVNRIRYPRPEHLLFISIGNRLQPEQTDWIRQHYRRRKFTLIFGSDLVGHLTDIKVTAAIKELQIHFVHKGQQVTIFLQEKFQVFEDEKISLHQFRVAFGIRANIYTRKPSKASSFLTQLMQEPC
jgi:hypothetical protein